MAFDAFADLANLLGDGAEPTPPPSSSSSDSADSTSEGEARDALSYNTASVLGGHDGDDEDPNACAAPMTDAGPRPGGGTAAAAATTVLVCGREVEAAATELVDLSGEKLEADALTRSTPS